MEGESLGHPAFCWGVRGTEWLRAGVGFWSQARCMTSHGFQIRIWEMGFKDSTELTGDYKNLMSSCKPGLSTSE